MADKQLKFNLTATDNASATFSKVGEHATSTTSKIGSAFGQLGSKIGGELGEVLDTVGEGFEKLGEHGQSSGKKLMAAGSAITGIGVALQVMGSKDQAAEQQLKASIDATGGSYEELEPKIKKTISSMETYGHSASETMNALQTLTTATGSGEKATELMGTAADLAAAKHETLTEASGQLAKILNGSGGKTLKQYGITMKTTGDKTANAQAALDQLSAKLKGQAAASADTFSGKLLEVKTRAEDAAAAFGAKFGGAITAAGPIIMGVGAILESGIIQKAGGAAKAMLGIGAAAAEGAAETATAAVASEAAVEGETEAVESSGRAAALANPLMLAAAVAVTVLGAAFLSHKRDADEAAAAVQKYTSAIEEDKGAVGEATEKMTAQSLASEGLYDKLGKLGLSQDTVTQAALGNKSAMEQLTKVTFAHGWQATQDGTKVLKMAVAIQGATKDVKQTKEALTDLHPTQASVTAAMVSMGLSTDKTTQQMQKQNDAAGLLTAALDRLNGNALGAEESEIAFKNAVATVTANVKTNGDSLNINTQKGRDNTSSILDAIKAANDHAAAIAKRTGSTRAGTSAFNSDIRALERSASAAGYNKGQIDGLIKAYGRTPRGVATTVRLLGVESAREALANLTVARNENIFVRTHSVGGYDVSKGYATGTQYSTPGVHMVGENGPELVQLPQGAKVSNASSTKSAMRSGGGGDIHITVNVAGSIRSDKDVAQVVVKEIALMQGRRGAVNIYGG